MWQTLNTLLVIGSPGFSDMTWLLRCDCYCGLCVYEHLQRSSPKERIVLIYQSYHLNLLTVAQLLLLCKYLRHDWKRVQMFLPKVGGIYRNYCSFHIKILLLSYLWTWRTIYTTTVVIIFLCHINIVIDAVWMINKPFLHPDVWIYLSSLE